VFLQQEVGIIALDCGSTNHNNDHLYYCIQYLLSLDILSWGDQRQFDVDNRCVLPVNQDVRFCVSSSDVIHA